MAIAATKAMIQSAHAAPSVSGFTKVSTITLAAGRLTSTFTRLSTSSWRMKQMRQMRIAPTAATPRSCSRVRRRRVVAASAPTKESTAMAVVSTTTASKMRTAS